MAIVQISRITQRKGVYEDLPEPLAGAELGWAVDERRLFIGNGELAEGAPIVGNTEILTEFSDVLQYTNQYTYKGEIAGYTVQTGATSGSPVTQSLQQRLDSYAIISDFGATGDGVTDVTAAINRALYQIYCRDTNPLVRRSIFFPAGTYIITDTLNIPTYATLYGDGADNTIISFDVADWTSLNAYAVGVLVYDIDSAEYYRSNFNVPVGTGILDNNPDGDPYWTAESLPEYIIQTADSLQQTGVNIGTNGATRPGNIEISGIKFVTNRENNGVLVENAAGCVFQSVTVEGPLGEADLTTATADIAAVRWVSTVSQVSRDVTFNNCELKGFTYATDTDEQIEGVTFSNSHFDTLHQGIILGGVSPSNGGPTGVRITQNTFDNIYAQGVVIENVSLNATAYNTFYDVGNHFNGYALAASSIIDIAALNNVSVGDMFGRNTSQSQLYPRINLNDTTSIALGLASTGITYYQDDVQDNNIGNQLNLGNFKQTAGVNDIITAGGTDIELAVINADDLKIPAFKFTYTILRNDNYRTGVITVVSGTGGTDTGFSYVDDYVESADTDVTLTVTHNDTPATPLITIAYTAASAGDGSINYSISYTN